MVVRGESDSNRDDEDRGGGQGWDERWYRHFSGEVSDAVISLSSPQANCARRNSATSRSPCCGNFRKIRVRQNGVTRRSISSRFCEDAATASGKSDEIATSVESGLAREAGSSLLVSREGGREWLSLARVGQGVTYLGKKCLSECLSECVSE